MSKLFMHKDVNESMNGRKLLKTLVAVVIMIGFAVAVAKVIQYPSQRMEKFTNRLLYERYSGADVAVAFATALRLNSEVMYDVTDPSLWPKLDEWMSHHQAKECDVWNWDNWNDGAMIGGGADGFDVFFYCELETGEFYTLEVHNIDVRGGFRVFGWQEVVEGPN